MTNKNTGLYMILFQESIAINRFKPSVNLGTKASKDLSILTIVIMSCYFTT